MTDNVTALLEPNASTEMNSSSTSNDDREEFLFGFYVEGLTLTLVSTVGFVGNCLSIIVLFEQGEKLFAEVSYEHQLRLSLDKSYCYLKTLYILTFV